MAKFHKSTAEQLVAAAELPTDAAAVEAVHSLTSALLDTIRTLQTDTQHGPAITLQGLQQHKLPTNMDKSAPLAPCTLRHPPVFASSHTLTEPCSPCALNVACDGAGSWSTWPRQRACSQWSEP